MRTTGLALVAVLMTPAVAIHAQERQDPGVYKADFTLHDSSDSAAKSGRKYSLLVNRGNKATFRIGSRIPYPTGGGEGVVQANRQFTYYDLGVNIDCVILESAGKFAMHANLDLSTIMLPDKSAVGATPTTSQIKIDIDTTVPAGKPTVVASFEDPVTSRKFDVEVTVTKI